MYSSRDSSGIHLSIDSAFELSAMLILDSPSLSGKNVVSPPIILANFNMDYKIPVQYPDLIKIVTQITHIGNTSFGIGHELYSTTNEEKIVALGSSVVVMIDYLSGEKVTIDKLNREKLSPYLNKN